MREITKTVSVPVNGKPMDFRLTKLDAFSGVSLLRMLSGMEGENKPLLDLFFSRDPGYLIAEYPNIDAFLLKQLLPS